MGRKLDALLGRNFKTSKFKTILQLAISRTSILSNQHRTRLSHARSDVKQLLMISQQDRAMLRVEHVVKEQNMVDVFHMIDFYCHLLFERAKLLSQDNECHEELKEAISSLIFAASRCGEFPELQKIREILTSKFGKEFAARSVELRNNCGVSPKMVQKFSTRRASFECRAKFLMEIGSECGVALQLEEDAPLSYEKTLQEEKKLEVKQKQEEEEIKPDKAAESNEITLARNITFFKDIKELEEFTESMKARRNYSGVAAAAQEAFESAAHAAVAARAAVELSMNISMEKKDDDRVDLDIQEGVALEFDVTSKTNALMINSSISLKDTDRCSDNSPSFEKAHCVEDVVLEAEAKNEIEDDSCDVHKKEGSEIECEPETEVSDSNKNERLVNASKDDSLLDEESQSHGKE